MEPMVAEGAFLTRRVREKIEKAAAIMEEPGALPERLSEAWWHLRPLFPTAVPGQAGLSVEQQRGLQGVLDILGGGRGAGASGADVRALDRRMQERAAIGIKRLMESLRTGGTIGGTRGIVEA